MTYNWSPWKKLVIGTGGRTAKGKSSAGASGSITAYNIFQSRFNGMQACF